VSRGLQDHNRTTPIRWPLVAGRYNIAPTCCPLTIDSYNAERPDNPAPHRACTWRPPYRWRHHLLHQTGSARVRRNPTTPGPLVMSWVTLYLLWLLAIKGHAIVRITRMKPTLKQHTSILLQTSILPRTLDIMLQLFESCKSSYPLCSFIAYTLCEPSPLQ
jgi:hypothetical protein